MSFAAKKALRVYSVIISLFVFSTVFAQDESLHWNKDGNSFLEIRNGAIAQIGLPDLKETVLIPKEKFIPKGRQTALQFKKFAFTDDMQTLLIFTNTKKVWRYNTRGDYWIYNRADGSLVQLGASLPPSSLMFAKLSPDGKQAAYVSNFNIYVEDLASHQVRPLTKDGSRKLINGTFDWAYEEEFFCRDGFRWSPDSKQIAFWQIDAKTTKDYYMIDNTDSIYPVIKPVEYPIVGEAPSPFKIGVVNISDDHITWMNIPTDPVWQSYVPRMEWTVTGKDLIIQHLSRRQNETELMLCNAVTGSANAIYKERDSAWIDIISLWDQDYSYGGWDWLNGGKEFLWASEKDGWRHLYRMGIDGKKETLVTVGNYDVMKIVNIDEKSNFLYFMASPNNATQAYLYRIRLDGKGKAEQLSPAGQPGTHKYAVSPNSKFARHAFSNYYTPNVSEWISLPEHKGLNGENRVNEAIAKADKSKSPVEFFKVKTTDGVEMDAWMVKPEGFDASKKYPVLFFVYTEPWGQNVIDEFGTAENFLYQGNLARDGYIYISIDNRGTPVPKGRAWRKSIYRKIGLVNIADQAAAAREILKWPFVDSSRIAVWGWSGGGSATLNLMFQYPDIYKTGIAVAAVSSQFTYDNIYQERYMGLPQENREDFIKGSPLTYAKNLKGNLLYIHGTGDDNVHYSNAELLLNELIKYNKIFQFMAYPNRTHGIFEGEGTGRHLANLYTTYLREHCPGGGK